MEWNATITDMKFHFKNNAFGNNNNEALNFFFSSSLLFAFALLLRLGRPPSRGPKAEKKYCFEFLLSEGME
jgi:hypothetical protein